MSLVKHYGDHSLLYEKDTSAFGTFFNCWRIKRVDKLLSIFGVDWFKGKKILEMGCAYGNIGLYLKSLGAEVDFCDGRSEAIKRIQEKNSNVKTFILDNEEDWSLESHYDLIVHFGILYNLNYWERDLDNVLKSCNFLALESAVTKYDNFDEYKIIPRYEIRIQGPLREIGTLTSSKNIEKVFKRNNFTFVRYDDLSLNTPFDNIAIYDWEEEENVGDLRYDVVDNWWKNKYCDNRRRFWIATNRKTIQGKPNYFNECI